MSLVPKTDGDSTEKGELQNSIIDERSVKSFTKILGNKTQQSSKDQAPLSSGIQPKYPRMVEQVNVTYHTSTRKNKRKQLSRSNTQSRFLFMIKNNCKGEWKELSSTKAKLFTKHSAQWEKAKILLPLKIMHKARWVHTLFLCNITLEVITVAIRQGK